MENYLGMYVKSDSIVFVSINEKWTVYTGTEAGSVNIILLKTSMENGVVA